jgi:hypothetical protein
MLNSALYDRSAGTYFSFDDTHTLQNFFNDGHSVEGVYRFMTDCGYLQHNVNVLTEGSVTYRKPRRHDAFDSSATPTPIQHVPERRERSAFRAISAEREKPVISQMSSLRTAGWKSWKASLMMNRAMAPSRTNG